MKVVTKYYNRVSKTSSQNRYSVATLTRNYPKVIILLENGSPRERHSVIDGVTFSKSFALSNSNCSEIAVKAMLKNN